MTFASKSSLHDIFRGYLQNSKPAITRLDEFLRRWKVDREIIFQNRLTTHFRVHKKPIPVVYLMARRSLLKLRKGAICKIDDNAELNEDSQRS